MRHKRAAVALPAECPQITQDADLQNWTTNTQQMEREIQYD
jgi:hypothetical protein